MNTLNELWQFLGGLYGGILIGIIYRVFTFLRLLFKNKWVTAVFDVLFYLIASSVLALTLLIINGGELRLFILFAVFLSAGLVIWASRSFVKILLKICKKPLVKKQ